jgi:hypothetical protein
LFDGEGDPVMVRGGPRLPPDIPLSVAPGAGGKKFRAFDKSNGAVVWETELPAGTTGTPITYLFEGKQYIVVAEDCRRQYRLSSYGVDLVGPLNLAVHMRRPRPNVRPDVLSSARRTVRCTNGREKAAPQTGSRMACPGSRSTRTGHTVARNPLSDR